VDISREGKRIVRRILTPASLGQSKIDEVELRSEAMGDGFSEAWKAGWVECAGRVAMSKLEILV
jgi:hypothetical protein